MKRSRVLFIPVGVLCILGLGAFASTAAAAPVQCGDVITEDLKLQADLTDCPDDGLVVGADRITINLNGHEVSSECQGDECIGRIGIDNSGFDRVRIRNGTVSGFEQTIRLQRSDRNTLADLEVDGGIVGLLGSISLVLDHSNRNVIRDSFVSGGDPGGAVLSGSDHNKFARSTLFGGGVIDIRNGSGLVLLDGSDANTLSRSTADAGGGGVTIWNSVHNSIRNSAINHGLSLFNADRTLIVGNDLSGGQGNGVSARGDQNTIRGNRIDGGIYLLGDRNLATANRITGDFGGLVYVDSGDRNVVRANDVTPRLNFASFGAPVIRVLATASRTSLIDKNASGGFDASEPGIVDGIKVDAPGTLIRGNTANDNDALGINAVDGVIDGGGNHASGNGDPRQCVGVVCTP
ncbi:MAG: right-handed parallel beta-helix repeat-containing protein [Solirubrobacterales bacterium]